MEGGLAQAAAAYPSLFCVAKRTPPHLPEVPDVEQVESLEQLAPLHAEGLAARRQEGPDVLQAQELWEGTEVGLGSEFHGNIERRKKMLSFDEGGWFMFY